MGKRKKSKVKSSGQTVTNKKAKRQSAVVRWEDGTENLVFINELEAVDATLPLGVGTQIKHFWKRDKQIYTGHIIELETAEEQEANQDTVNRGEEQEANQDTVKRGEEQEANQDTVNRGEEQEADQDTVNRGEEQEADKDMVNRGKEQEADQDTVNRGEEQEADQDTVSRGEEQEADQDTVSRGEEQEADRDTVNRGEEQEADQDTVNRGEEQEADQGMFNLDTSLNTSGILDVFLAFEDVECFLNPLEGTSTDNICDLELTLPSAETAIKTK